jgi:hypothetical protein
MGPDTSRADCTRANVARMTHLEAMCDLLDDCHLHVRPAFGTRACLHIHLTCKTTRFHTCRRSIPILKLLHAVMPHHQAQTHMLQRSSCPRQRTLYHQPRQLQNRSQQPLQAAATRRCAFIYVCACMLCAMQTTEIKQLLVACVERDTLTEFDS